MNNKQSIQEVPQNLIDLSLKISQELDKVLGISGRVSPKQKPGNSKQDYATPWVFLSAVQTKLGIKRFHIDLAANAENTKAEIYYDLAYDALLREGDWINEGWNWLNPSYANIEPWVTKAYTESLKGAKIAVLLPASVGSNWWAKWVHQKAVVVFVRPRLVFGGHTAPYPKDLALLLYDESDSHGIAPYYVTWNWKED